MLSKACKRLGKEGPCKRPCKGFTVVGGQVRETLNKFEERVWSIIRNCVRLGQENPALLVTAARIVKLQETVDLQLEASGISAPPSYQPSRGMCSNRYCVPCCML